jgi:hypothetical protein
LPTGIELETTDNAKLTSTWNVKIAHSHDWDYKIGDQVLLKKMVSSANQKFGMNVILGLSHQFIQMGKSGFNVKQNLNVNIWRVTPFFNNQH